MPVGAASDDVEGQVLRLKLDLTVTQLDHATGQLWLDHEHTFGTCNPDLEGTDLSVAELLGSLKGKLWADVAHSVGEGEVIPFDVRDPHDHLFGAHLADKF